MLSQPLAFVPCVSSDQGHLEPKLHQHRHKARPANASTHGLYRKHAFVSGLRHSLFREQSFSLEATMPKLKCSLDDMRTMAGKGNESLSWTTSQTFFI